MKNYALINKGNNIIENVILWDGVSPYDVPDHMIAVEITEPNVGIGWRYEAGDLIEPSMPEVLSANTSSETTESTP